MNTGPSITCIVGMLFHWLQKWLTSFKYFTHFFPPHIWHSEQIIRWFTTEGITCDSFILFSTGVASQNVPAVDATPTSTHLHPGVGFPLWNSRLPFVFLPQIREHWTAGFCNETVHSQMCFFWTSMENDSYYTIRVQNWEIYVQCFKQQNNLGATSQ